MKNQPVMTGRVSKIIMCLYVWLTCGEALAQQAPCMSYMDSITILCYDNFTPLDSTDDFYHIGFWVFGGSGSQTDSFRIGWEGNPDFGHFVYGTYHELTFPSNGQPMTLYATDLVQGQCMDSLVTPPLISCSSPCRFDTSVHVEIHCNNATTANNTADDYYSVSFEIPCISTKDGYLVYIDGDSMGLFAYNQLNYVNRPADSLHHVIEFRDSRDESCFFTTLLGRFIPCSADCYIEKQYLSIECDNKGTAFDISDDQLYITSVITTYRGTDSFHLFIDDVWVVTQAYGDTLRLILPYASGALSIKIEDQLKSGCTYFDTWELPAACSVDCSKLPVLTADLGEDLVLNCFEPCTLIKSASPPGYHGVWKNLGTGEVFTADSFQLCVPGQFEMNYIYTQNGCPGQPDTIAIAIDTSVNKPMVGVKQSSNDLCTKAQYLLSVTREPEHNYYWRYQNQLWSEDSLVSEGPAMVWAIAVNHRNGCRDSLQVQLAGPVVLSPVMLLPIDTLSCRKKEIQLGIVGSPLPGLHYQWQKEGSDTSWWQGVTLNVEAAGKYKLRLTDKTGKCKRDTVVQVLDLTQQLSIAVIEVPLLGCTNDTFSIEVQVYNQQGEKLESSDLHFEQGVATGKWLQPGPVSSVFSGEGTGSYTLTAEHLKDGCVVSATFDVKAKPSPAIQWQSENESCFQKSDGRIFLIGESQHMRQWSLNDKEQDGNNAEGLNPGKYALFAIDTQGCRHDTLITIAAAEELKIQIGADVLLAYGQTTLLRAEVNRSLGELASYGWSPEEKVSCVSCMEAWVEGREDGRFIFKATDRNGCEAEASVRVQIERNIIITAPNIIALDLSGNNYFTIYGNEQVKRVNELKIFDRWGNAMWQTTTDCLNQPTLGWDGTLNGSQIETGVYTYVAEVEIFSGEKKIVSGDITWVK